MRQIITTPLLLCSLLLLAAAACRSSDDGVLTTTPQELRGFWISDKAEYAGRSMEILEEAILFHTGEYAFDPYIIRSIVVEPGNNGTGYEIEHSGWETGEMTLSLFFRTEDSTIVFRNQPLTIWRRVPEEG